MTIKQQAKPFLWDRYRASSEMITIVEENSKEVQGNMVPYTP